ncbi:MAG: leucine-rich repeat domain-containing protein [Lachnospiraceae bacterium]
MKAVFTCSKCTSATDGHSKTIDCSVDVKENSSSCTTAGSKVYTASVTFNEKTYTDTKTDTIAATGHTLTHKEAVSATCTTEGNKEYWLCTTCGKLYSDAAGTKETTAQEVKIAASGHTYTKITDNNDGTSHSISCSVCGDVHTAKENHTGGTATCYARAKCEKCNAEYGSLASHTYGAPDFTWTSTATGYMVNAVFTCTNTGCTATAEGHSKSEVCTVEGLVTKQADCTTAGSKVYTASVTFNGKTYTDTRTDTIAATGHSMVHTDAVSAGTCTGDGNKEYWSCSQCGKYYLDSQGNTETTLEDVTIKAPGHDYSGVVDNGNGTHSASCTRCGTTFEAESHCGGTATCVTKAHCEVCNAEYGYYGEHSYGEPKFQWQKTDDGYTATAVFTCTNDGCTEVTEGHTKERNCTVEGLVTKQATCDEEGSMIYTATLTEEGKNYQDTKTVSLDVLEHDLEHVTAVEAGCTTAGNIEYWKCTNCNKLYSDEAGTKETTAENVVIAASGHKYDSIVPDQDGTSHTISCSVCGDIQIAGELHSGGTATCYAKAKCEKCNAEYGEIAAHTYGTPVFNWTSTESGYTVEAVFTCSNGGCTESADGHSKSETCAVEKTDVKEAGCTEAGSISYEASVTFNGQTYTDTKTDIIEAVGHSMEHVEKVSAGTCTGDGNEEYWKCSRCGRYYLDSQGQTETSLEDVTIKAPGHAYKDVVDNGDGTHSASCERCGETISGESHFGGTATCAEQAHCEVCDAKYGEYGEHRYGEPEFQWQAAGDGYTATAVFTCVNDGCTTSLDGHTVTVDCTVEGPVVTEATTEMTGSKVYTAKVTFNEQQYTDTRTDVIPVVDTGKKPEESNPAQNPGTTGGTPEQPVPSVGERVTDSATKAVYEVTASFGNEAAVTYVGPASKTETKATVPATVMIGNVSYKVTAIAKNAFANNKKLKTVTIGKNVTTIGDKAFYKCTSLTKVTIPENVKSLGKQAFYGDKKLKTITIKSTVLTKVGNKALTGIDKKATIKCPNKKTAAKYKKLFKSKTGYKKTMKIK